MDLRSLEDGNEYRIYWFYVITLLKLLMRVRCGILIMDGNINNGSVIMYFQYYFINVKDNFIVVC